MSKAIIYIVYHPAPLLYFDHLIENDHKECTKILITFKRLNVNKEILDLYGPKYDYLVVLSDVDYLKNIFRGFKELLTFKKDYRERINPMLKNIDSFDIVSDCSAYLPVNVVISGLKKNKKCGEIISIRPDFRFSFEIDIFKSIFLIPYYLMFGLYPVYYHKRISYTYFKEQRNRVYRFYSAYEDPVDQECEKYNVPVENIFRPTNEKGKEEDKDLIIFYSDLGMHKFSSLTVEEYQEKLKKILTEMAKYYENYKIICNPHPKDELKVVSALDNIKYELYKGGLTSQMYVEKYFKRIKACYAISSTSVLYSAVRGIPSYTFYKYLNLNENPFGIFFENDTIKKNPFLCNIKDVDEIGNIDSVNISKPYEIKINNMKG